MTETDENLEDSGDIPAVADSTAILADLLHDRGPLPEPELLKTFVEVLRDLEQRRCRK